jgi:branched-chain amino acid transport system substrate-binding protein
MKKLPYVLVLVLVLSPLSCDSKPESVVIGVALTSSNHAGVELAVKEINESGGIGGVPVKLMGLEWKVGAEFEAADIIKWANDFARTENLVAVIGHSDSASTLSAAAIYNQQRVPQIVTIATNPAITNIGGWTYRLCLSDATQGVALAQYAVKDWGKKAVSTFYVNDAYGRGLAGVFEREVRGLGATVLSSRMHRNVLQADDKEMIKASLNSLRAGGGPDLFALFQRWDAANWTINAIREAGFHADILGGDSLGRPGATRTGQGPAEELRVSQFYLPSADDSTAMSFVDSFRKYTGVHPDYGQAFAYDAVYLVRDALLTSGFSREGVKAYLDNLIKEKTVVNGVGGSYAFGPDHDARRTMYIVEVGKSPHPPLKAIRLD